MPEELRNAYRYMTRNRKRPVEEVRTNLIVLKIEKFELVKFRKIMYPEITAIREDNREWTFSEADI